MARTQTYTHDDRNRLISVVDGEGRKVHYGYDAADRVTEFKSPAGNVYGFGYDLNGNRTQVRMPSGAVHRLEHTSLNQPRSYTPPGGVGLRHDYDRDRAATSTTLAGGRIVSSAYDGGGRPTGSEYDEADVVLAYADQTGRPKSLIRTPLQGEDQHIVFSYDGALVTAEQFSVSAQGAASYSHDDDFRVTGSTLTSGAQTVSTTVAYDPDGRPTTIGPFELARGGPAGAPSGMGDDTMEQSFRYDTNGRLSGRSQSVTGTARYDIDLGFDAAGRIVRRTDKVAGESHIYTYAYDDDGQLERVERDGQLVERYDYDENGNRIIHQSGDGPPAIATYDVQDRLKRSGSTCRPDPRG